jgi:hypothetical protein
MTRIDIGQLIQVAANLGVIAGIVFLGIEISQNNELMEAQARYNRLVSQTGSQTLIANNAQLAELLAKNDMGAELTPAERRQFEALYGRAIVNIAWAYGELPVSQLPVSQYQSVFNERGVRLIWDRMKASYDPEFVRFIEEDVLLD